MSTTARKTWLKILRVAGVKHFRARSGLGFPFVCHVGDESGEMPFYQPNYSVPELLLMAEWCSHLSAPVVFDVGANNGFIATQLAQLLSKNKAQIYAFEPVPTTFAQLELSVKWLGLDDVVFPICRALSDSNSLVKMSYHPRQSLFAQVTGNVPNPRVGSCMVEANASTVDEMSDRLGAKPDVLKVDVEGYESRVLQGAKGVLGSSNPPAICFEWNPLTFREVGASGDQLAGLLANYALYYIDDFEGQRRSFAARIMDVARLDWVCNLFAVPNTSAAGERWIKVASAGIPAKATIR